MFGLVKRRMKLICLCVVSWLKCVYQILCRCYPGPWKVLRRVGSSKFVCLHQQDTMPSLKEVALEILPKNWFISFSNNGNGKKFLLPLCVSLITWWMCLLLFRATLVLIYMPQTRNNIGINLRFCLVSETLSFQF